VDVGRGRSGFRFVSIAVIVANAPWGHTDRPQPTALPSSRRLHARAQLVAPGVLPVTRPLYPAGN